MGPVDLNEAARVFTDARPRLFGIAYRMLGSVTEAEDLVQDVWLRWQGYDRESVENPAAFLATTTTRLAINHLQSARVRRETYIGPWLPEPVDTSADPYLGAETGNALEFAVLLLLEKLTPTERAAYVLREAFDYPYGQIAEILRSNEPAVRQWVSRARKHVTGERKAPAPVSAQRELLTTFITAARSGDLAGLEKLFAAEVASITDGNGAKHAARRVVVGADKVARFIAAFSSFWWDGIEVRHVVVNGRPGAVLRQGDEVKAVLTLSASADGIDQLMWQMNQEKVAAFR
ncbi:RNA polymerase sigma24 factor [Paractinoplanes abujensis]|uniref:RNA polymerase sigma-70 factor (ECF subfamily) n=1 Tax=Paractinoplanes abujensis TaxID=882441 RepID=A0A7W7CMK2_9ACTN|nr:RNA polymerase sigma-70 factor [Actinoplanes abujensis]MBB4691292.1 RNA polymerase sigma-70 factor (ECF subfamily) [Actinoplanes abujensis]GID17293.1 RNA polymerase sigma24 factor [Actinoplanes abujensis]